MNNTTIPQQPDIKLICFDIGGVIISHINTWEQAFTRANIPFPPTENFESVEPQANLAALQYEIGEIDTDTFNNLIAQYFNISTQNVEKIVHAWLIEPYPGIIDLINKLQHAAVKTACLSNTNHTHWQLICHATPHSKLLIPLKQMNYLFASFKLNCRKPDLEIYQHVEKTSSLTGPEIAFFDDKPANLKIPKQLNWQTCLIDPANNPTQQITSFCHDHHIF